MANKPTSESVRIFLKGNLGKKSFAPLTSTDYRCLMAAALIMEAYSYSREPTYLEAFAIMVRGMQPKCYYFAYHAIACVMDWAVRMPLWMQAGLPTEPLENTPRCEFEPAVRESKFRTAAGETRAILDEAAGS